MSDLSPITEATNAQHTTAIVGVSQRPSGDSIRGKSNRRPRTNEPSNAGTVGAIRDSDKATDSPTIEIIGELSDAAIDAIAQLLIDDYLKSHTSASDCPNDAGLPSGASGD